MSVNFLICGIALNVGSNLIFYNFRNAKLTMEQLETWMLWELCNGEWCEPKLSLRN